MALKPSDLSPGDRIRYRDGAEINVARFVRMENNQVILRPDGNPSMQRQAEITILWDQVLPPYSSQ